MLAFTRRADRLVFRVRVTPRASSSGVGPVREGALAVRVTAAPAEGAANEAVVRVLAKALGTAPSTIRIERGATARDKVVSAPSATEAALLLLAGSPQ